MDRPCQQLFRLTIGKSIVSLSTIGLNHLVDEDIITTSFRSTDFNITDMVFFESPLYVKALGVSGIGAFASITGFFVYTKHCDVQNLPVTDPLFSSAFYKQYNPRANPSMRDVCVRRIPLHQIRPDLLADDKKGGGRLVEAFCGGIYGGKGKSIPYSVTSSRSGLGREQSRLHVLCLSCSSILLTRNRLHHSAANSWPQQATDHRDFSTH